MLDLATKKQPPPNTQSSTDDDAENDLDVELSDVNEALLDPIAHERISNYRRIVRLNSAHVSKLNALVAKVSGSGNST